MTEYPKRLIEVDLPIRRISAHARREKSIRHGHISTLHIWWARRPLAACRAVLCAALWPDPADPLCPEQFREAARAELRQWAGRHIGLASAESYSRLNKIQKQPNKLDNNQELRTALLDFIADFANWDSSNSAPFLSMSRALTDAAHQSLGGIEGTRPLLVDPFAGGGSIPLEGLRVGADSFATDLNPVAVLLNKVILEFAPRYGSQLIDEVDRWGSWVQSRAEEALAPFYPVDGDGGTPSVYIWARTITCEGPGCGVEIPLLRSPMLVKKGGKSVGVRLHRNQDSTRLAAEVIQKPKQSELGQGTSRRGAATCPICGYTTPVAAVRRQLAGRNGGTKDVQLIAVGVNRPGHQGRVYRSPTDGDVEAAASAAAALASVPAAPGGLSAVPNESTEKYESFVNRGPLYGMKRWDHYFTDRQALTLATYSQLVREAGEEMVGDLPDDLRRAVQTCLAFAVDRCANQFSSLSKWHSGRETVDGVFARQALPMLWDFGEINPLGGRDGYWNGALQWITSVLGGIPGSVQGQAERASATAHPLPDDAAAALVTDPPYYYSVQYADLSDYFYVWLRRNVGHLYPSLFATSETPKEDEIIVQTPAHQFASTGKNKAFFESRMQLAMAEGRRVLAPNGIGVVVFAHTSTDGWEAQLQAMVDAGWVITGSWPIDTEMANRVISQNRSVLASSVHIVCRPRENADGQVRSDLVGDWSDVLRELPKRIHDWMPRLADEGVVGADAIFACLGPALAIFSRYSHVEKANGERVSLRDYLEHVWAAVSREALTMIFTDADASGFEEDARLTAMWLWTLSTTPNGAVEADGEIDPSEGDEEERGAGARLTGLTLEYDAARKIAQGLGARLDSLEHLVEVKGDTARLLPVTERTTHLFGGTRPASAAPKRNAQLGFGDVMDAPTEDGRAWDVGTDAAAGQTVLDRVHQAMLLFAAGRSDALARLLSEQGVGRDTRFWKLAQAFSALYPAGTDEKRWVDGVLARKKSLGF